MKSYPTIYLSWLFALLILLPLQSCEAQKSTKKKIYQKGITTRDGIGKYYFDREIAHVMGHLGARWLERSDRDDEENTTLAIKNLNLQPTDVVADIGAGTGYYTFRMAEQLTDGKVYAVDIQPQMLAIMQEKIDGQQISNVELILSNEQSTKLPENSIDMAMMVDVYHELSYPKEVMESIVKALKPDGRFILLEYRLEDPTVPIKRLHKMSLKQAIKEMKAVGLQLQENKDNLPWQHFMIFVKA